MGLLEEVGVGLRGQDLRHGRIRREECGNGGGGGGVHYEAKETKRARVKSAGEGEKGWEDLSTDFSVSAFLNLDIKILGYLGIAGYFLPVAGSRR